MKIQFQEGLMRVRSDETELAELLDGGELALKVASAGQSVFSLKVQLAERLALRPGKSWRLDLPADQVRAFAGTLPRRDALVFQLPGATQPIQLDFEVDVRDSRKLRGRSRS
jgi:hypothetical protein